METTPLAMFGFYVERVKANLRIVLALSPIGDAFRNRLRMFPSLINCCTIDWYVLVGLFCGCVLIGFTAVPADGMGGRGNLGI